MSARISFRVSSILWSHPERCRELLSFLGDYRDTVSEVAFFTGFTHPPLPLSVIRQRAAVLKTLLPRFRDAGFRCGINHLATLGHLDENLDNSLREPWQHLVNIDGTVSKSCYCASDPRLLDYVRETYRLFADTGAEFIWVDDDVRLESHGPSIHMGCFCEGCLAAFSRQFGRVLTREELVRAFDTGLPAERLAQRQAWQEHNRRYLADLLRVIRAAVDEVDPGIRLGFMTGEISYSGYGFAECVEAMAGPRRLEVKWRPGGGFYEDSAPTGLLTKAHGTGRQIAFIPTAVTDVQYEHENFPYQVLKKSTTVFVAECAASLGAGCTGVALNCMGIVPDPLDEFRPWFAGVQRGKAFLDRAAAAFGRSLCDGVWPAFTRNHVAAQALDGPWTRAALWGTDMHAFNELFEIGLPPAYAAAGARVTLLTGAAVAEFSREELLGFLAGGVLLDGTALPRLAERGLEEHVGWAVREPKEKDTIEALTADPLNGRFAGWHRDCRPSFWPETTWLLRPLTAASRPLCEIGDFAARSFGPCSGAFENTLGGRVAVLGYYPWRLLQSLAKSSQMKALCRWLSKDALPAYVGSSHKAALWCRRTPDGQPAALLLNASLDAADTIDIHWHGREEQLWVHRLHDPPVKLERVTQDGNYAVFRLPPLGPWQPALCLPA